MMTEAVISLPTLYIDAAMPGSRARRIEDSDLARWAEFASPGDEPVAWDARGLSARDLAKTMATLERSRIPASLVLEEPVPPRLISLFPCVSKSVRVPEGDSSFLATRLSRLPERYRERMQTLYGIAVETDEPYYEGFNELDWEDPA